MYLNITIPCVTLLRIDGLLQGISRDILNPVTELFSLETVRTVDSIIKPKMPVALGYCCPRIVSFGTNNSLKRNRIAFKFSPDVPFVM